MTKENEAYKTIGEVAKLLNLKSKSDKSYPTHTIRFWEKEFKQIKPKILNGNRRYYDNKTIELLKKVKFLIILLIFCNLVFKLFAFIDAFVISSSFKVSL